MGKIDYVRQSRIQQIAMLIKKATEQKAIRGEIIKDKLIELIIDKFHVSERQAKDLLKDAELRVHIKVPDRKWSADELAHFQHYDWGEEMCIAGLQREYEGADFNHFEAIAELEEDIQNIEANPDLTAEQKAVEIEINRKEIAKSKAAIEKYNIVGYDKVNKKVIYGSKDKAEGAVQEGTAGA